MTSHVAMQGDRLGGIRVLIDSGADTLPAVIEEVRRTLHGWKMDHRADDAALVVDELVMNAAQHVGGELIVQLLPLDEGFHLEVADRDPDFRAHAPVESPERYGLKIVDSVCDRWGVAPVVGSESGKIVWAEFHTGGSESDTSVE